MQKLKSAVKQVIAHKSVRKLLFIAHIPFAWLLIRVNGLFDDDWYRLQYGGHRHEKYKNRWPLLHYLYVGRKTGLVPNPFFVPEYFDRQRWQHSILDPLLKYVLRSGSWSSATSVLFDGGRYNNRGRIRAPLSLYLSNLRTGSESIVYDVLHTDKKWSEVRDQLHSSALMRRRQYESQKPAEPAGDFDELLSRETIQKYASFFDAEDDQPLVSIVTPAWNREKLVGQAIESVFAQTYSNWELLVVDDGSTDNTANVVKKYSQKDGRVKLFTPGRGGVCKARNHGIKQATGKWVAFLDSDNTWTPEYLTTVVAMLEDKKILAGYAAIKMNRNEATLYRTTQPDPELLKVGNYVDLNALIVDRKTLNSIDGFDTSLRRMVDYDLAIRLSRITDFCYVPIIGVEYTDHEDAARITTTESVSWDGVVKNKNFIDWQKLATNDKQTVDIVVPVRDGSYQAAQAIKSILATVDMPGARVVVADASSNASLNMTVGSFAALDSRLVYERFAEAHDTVLAANYGFSKTQSRKVVFVGQHVIVEKGWLEPLLKEVDDGSIAGPLQLQPSRTVRSAGVEFHGFEATPINLLEDHPISDIAPLDDIYDVDGLMNGCFAINATLFAKLCGLNPLYEGGFELQDLSLRARGIGAKTVVAKQSQVVNPDGGRGWYAAGQKQYLADWQGKVDSKQSKIWQQAGFRVARYEQLDPDMGKQSRLRPILEATNKKPGKYRWAIKISSPADERRHAWGDTHYAKALAKSLEKLGQRVAIDYHDYHQRPTSYLDDVLLDLRGLDDTKPQPGALNIMWVISHPEKLTPEIVNNFDVVFAAGKKWAEYMTEQSNKTVHYLPQCTDPEVFHPTEPDPKYEGRVIFVGNSRNVLRPIVRDAIAAGIDFDVYGGGWEGLVDEKFIRDTFIANDRLAYAYSTAAVSLNDHWSDMREWGFISNRIFDILAAGGTVVSDDVYGLEQTVKSSSLHVYKNVEELRKLIRDVTASKTHQRSGTEETVEYICSEHSFDARAKTLLKHVDK